MITHLHTALTNSMFQTGRLPLPNAFHRHGHWALRVPMIALLLHYGIQKFPDAILAPDGYGVPAILFTLAALAEVGGAIALALGGVVESLRPHKAIYQFLGDTLTRLGGLGALGAVGGVVWWFYWDSFTLSDPYAIKLGLALYFVFRGNLYQGVDTPKTVTSSKA